MIEKEITETYCFKPTDFNEKGRRISDGSAECELARPKVKAVLAEKDKTGTWLSEQMGRNIGTVSRWMTNKVQPSVEQLYDIAHYLDVDIRELLVTSK